MRVVDGDTLEIAGERVRLYGIDSSEAGQTCARRGGGTWPCGKEAIASLERLTAAVELECDHRGRDDYGCILAVCMAGELEVNRALVHNGLAWSYRRDSH